jgi:hypothetical protein
LKQVTFDQALKEKELHISIEAMKVNETLLLSQNEQIQSDLEIEKKRHVG